MQKVRVAIAGATGYAGEADLRMCEEQPDELLARIPGGPREGDPNYLLLRG